jgi:hypothetical protein
LATSRRRTMRQNIERPGWRELDICAHHRDGLRGV